MTTQNLIRSVLVSLFTLSLVACGGPSSGAKTTSAIGPQGGVVTTSTGFRLEIPAGALKTETEIHVTESEPHQGVARFELEPHDLVLAAKAKVSVALQSGSGPMKLVEIRGEVEQELEQEHGVETETEHHREAELEHLGALELRHQNVCAVACGVGFECDDGACKVHVEDPSAPAASGGNCPAGMELDLSDNVCKAHGGSGGTVGTPPVNGTCPAGMELDITDGTCKVHGGATSTGSTSGSGSSTGGTVGTPPVNGTCPVGMELDTTDGTCKAHGGSKP